MVLNGNNRRESRSRDLHALLIYLRDARVNKILRETIQFVERSAKLSNQALSFSLFKRCIYN